MSEIATRELGAPFGDLDFDPKDLAKEGIEGMAREGARFLLQTALALEVAEYLGRYWYERSGGEQAGYCNGYRTRSLACGAGPLK